MANRKLFKSPASVTRAPAADTTNRAGGSAYKMSDKHALAQIACTNCFNGTFYASAEENLKIAKQAALALTSDPEFIAKVAVYSRTQGYMKDMPAFLCTVLAGIDPPLFRRVFRRVINNGKMLRNFIQMARSGAVGGRSFNMSAGTCRHAIQEWFNSKSPWALFKAQVGNDPSMRDILRMARPKPNTAEKSALYGYFLGKDVDVAELPEVARLYEEYKRTKKGDVPNVDFRLLDSLGLGPKEWTQVAINAPWMMTRMNLNTFARHDVFKGKQGEKTAEIVAARLRNAEEIAKAMQFPYQMYTAWQATNESNDIPFCIKDALQDAMEISINNVPVIPGTVYVCVDTSGSMGSSITGSSPGRKASTTQCVQVAGLIASAIVRKNRSAQVYTFNTSATHVSLNPRDTVITNTQKLARAGGGTSISVPLRDLNAQKAKGDAVIYVSDYESWFDSYGFSGYNPLYGSSTGLASEWELFKKRNPKARLICIDLTPRSNSQIKEREDVLQVGGFSDAVFNVVSSFVEHGSARDHWVDVIERVAIDEEVAAVEEVE